MTTQHRDCGAKHTGAASVFLNEPPRTQYDLNFSLLGIPVRVHPMFWGIALLMGLGGNPKLPEMLMWVGTVFVSILVHEMGHALAARAFGWPPHITLHGFGGLASYRPSYHSPVSQILITAAGPAAGFAFALVICAAIAASGHRVTIDRDFGFVGPIYWDPYHSRWTDRLILDLLFVNIFWGLVNLLPIIPLDGGQIARELLGLANPRDGLRQALWLSVISAAVAAILAYTKLHDTYLTFLFAYLAYNSYTALQAMFGPGGGLGGFR